MPQDIQGGRGAANPRSEAHGRRGTGRKVTRHLISKKTTVGEPCRRRNRWAGFDSVRSLFIKAECPPLARLLAHIACRNYRTALWDVNLLQPPEHDK